MLLRLTSRLTVEGASQIITLVVHRRRDGCCFAEQWLSGFCLLEFPDRLRIFARGTVVYTLQYKSNCSWGLRSPFFVLPVDSILRRHADGELHFYCESSKNGKIYTLYLFIIDGDFSLFY